MFLILKLCLSYVFVLAISACHQVDRQEIIVVTKQLKVELYSQDPPNLKHRTGELRHRSLWDKGSTLLNVSVHSLGN
jgi:hypothetical protein